MSNLFVLSGPSGVGKDAVLSHLLNNQDKLELCQTVTTRSKRDGEEEGNPYFFVDIEQFLHMVADEKLLEFNRVNGRHFYGIPKQQIEDRMKKGVDVILKIDVRGSVIIKQKIPKAISIFLMPPNLHELEKRLRGRATETEDDIKIRLLDAKNEIEQSSQYDYIVLSDEIELATHKIKSIILAESLKVNR